MAFDPDTKADGHMYAQDPRHLLWRSFGCPFPTIPPYRWRVYFPFANGEFSPLNGGIFCDPTGPDEHPQVTWEATLPPLYSVSDVQVNKDHRSIGAGDEYAYTILVNTFSGLLVEEQTDWSTRRCNLPVAIHIDTTGFSVGNNPGNRCELRPYQWFAD